MGFISVILALFLISFNCNIKLSTSRKNGHLERNFISISTNSVSQRSCTCIMPTSCSCCEIVKILYTGDEQRLCFNMVYQRNGLNFDLSMDSTIIKSMTVANYRPFRMCASVPGLLLTSICVNVLDLSQLARSVVVCPRLEVSTKIQRWHISYACQNVSTDLPTGITPLTAAGSSPMQVMMMPMMGAAMRPPTMGLAPGVMMMAPMMPPAAGGAAPARPPAPPTAGPVAGVMMMAPMMPPAAGGAAPPRPAAPPGPAPPPAAQQMMPIAGMMVMGMRPAGAAMMPAPAPPPTPAAMPPAPPAGAQPPPAATPPAAPAAPRPPAAPTPPGATPAMAAMMVPPGVIVPRPANGLVYSLQPLFRTAPDDSSYAKADISDGSSPAESIRFDSTVISLEDDQSEQRSLIETDTEPAISDDEKEAEFTTRPVLEEATGDRESTVDDAKESITESEQESGRVLNRKKRQYDIFDVFQQSNRCDRAYRICITRSNNYIVSRLRNTRFNSNKNKNMDCNDRPTKIVHSSGDNLCSYLTSTIANNSGGAFVSFGSDGSNTQNSDTLDAIIVHDDSEEDSDFYTQNYPQTASITPYNRPRVFPLRTPPLVASQLKEQLKNLTNETLIISRM